MPQALEISLHTFGWLSLASSDTQCLCRLICRRAHVCIPEKLTNDPVTAALLTVCCTSFAHFSAIVLSPMMDASFNICSFAGGLVEVGASEAGEIDQRQRRRWRRLPLRLVPLHLGAV